MWDIKACTVCFSNNVKLFNMDIGDLRAIFNLVSGIKTHIGDGLPHYLCVECCSFVKRSKTFRDKCQKAHFALLQILHYKKQITLSSLKALDRKSIGVAPTLAKFNIEKANIVDNHIFDCLVETNGVGVNTSLACNENQLDKNKYVKKEKKEPKVSVTIQEFVQRFTDDVDFDDHGDDGFDNTDQQGLNSVTEIEKFEVDVDNIEEEYAITLPITMQEAKAAFEIEKLRKLPRDGDYVCKMCGKVYRKGGNNRALYVKHKRMHDMHMKGTFTCEICKYYYKTQSLLDAHMNRNHNYKYLCTKCLEVSFDRASAKYHFFHKHMNKEEKRPSWLQKRSKKGVTPKLKGKVKVKGTTSTNKENKPKEEEQVKVKWTTIMKAPDFPLVTPIKHEEQYQIIEDRKKTRNYIESTYKCELCYKGFRNKYTYQRHLIRHDPSKSGPLKCDACHTHFHDTRGAYTHMATFHTRRFSCRMCDYVNYNLSQAMVHYRWHKNVTYKCQFCDKVFTKISTCLTHTRLKHPSIHLCRLCGHSFVSEHGLNSHYRMCHSDEELKQLSVKTDPSSALYCTDCNVQFLNEEAHETHFGSSVKHAHTNQSYLKKEYLYKKSGAESKGGRKRNPNTSCIVNNSKATPSACVLCGLELVNDVQARKHYEKEHPGEDYLKRYMCDVCGHTTKQYANLVVHMRKHTRERPYKCPYCDRRFSMASNRDRHIFVHTGEKRYECQHCSRRFTQSSAVKLHVQTVHLKIPYAPWDKANRKRKQKRKKSDMEVVEVVEEPIDSQQIETEQPHYVADYMQEYFKEQV